MERISFGRMFSNAQQNISRNFARVFSAQNQLATGRRINRPSDDIVGTRRLLTLAGERANIDRHLSNVGTARSAINTSSAQLQELTSILSTIREKAVQGSNGTLTPDDRVSIANEIDALLQTGMSALNTSFEGRFLFAGTSTADRPFELITGADGVQRLQYNGNNDLAEVDVAPDLRLPVNLAGGELMRAGTRGATLFSGATGAAVGTGGTDTGTGRDVLQVRHTQTTFSTPPATGLTASATSPGNDTILGAGHSVTVTTDALGNGTISLNGGPAVAFTPADTDLQVTGPNGELIHVDTSAMAPNLAPGTVVPIQTTGTLSTDGGATTTAINFGAGAQQVINSGTGSVLHVDATAITGTGDEAVTYPGTSDFVTAIMAIRDTLMNTSLDASDVNDRLNVSIADLDQGVSAVTRAISVLGSRAGQLDSIEGRLGDLGVTLDGLSGEIADADISKVISDLSRYETLYQASLALTTRVNGMSLLNYM